MSEDVPFRSLILPTGPEHYYGDAVRIMFIVAAVIIFVMQFMSIETPFSSFGLILVILCLVIAAGLTNPVQVWIHWVNVVLSAFGIVTFGGLALERFRAVTFSVEHALIGFLVVIFVAALYLSTKTLRGILMRDAPVIE